MASFLLIPIFEFLAIDVHIPHQFATQAKHCIFLDYPVSQRAYKLYDLATHQMFISHDVVFHETIFPYESIPSTSLNLAPVIPLFVSNPFPLVQQPSLPKPISPIQQPSSPNLVSLQPSPNSPPPEPILCCSQ